MKLFLRCDRCQGQVEVHPRETNQYRSVSCPNCGAELPFLNAELKVDAKTVKPETTVLGL
jgi:DNA-directed RNA polymerase subunit RPC12/RpoP